RDGPPYVQSYFICFGKKIIRSFTFQRFWNKVKYLEKYKKVVRLYEAGLTSLLFKAGFKYSVFLDTTKLKGTDHTKAVKPWDVAVSRPDIIIKNNLPFIKIKAVKSYPVPYAILESIRNLENYPPILISEYFNEMHNPNASLGVYDRYISPSLFKTKRALPLNLKIAVHLHAHFLDVFEQYICHFNEWQFKFDLYITTDLPEKKTYIETYIENNFINRRLTEVVITENIGRDVLPWLSLSGRLNNYDIVGHFHTKKSTHAGFWIGEIWQEDMFKMLLIPARTIMEVFCNISNVGMVIPDIASCFHIRPHVFSYENVNKRIIAKMWKKMKCTKDVPFKDLPIFIMHYGNMFWYKPAALKPLFDLGLSANDFPGEPLPLDGTITHAIERITTYISWNSGYDFRIIKNERSLYNGFIDNMAFNHLYSHILKSRTYLITKALFFLPKIIKKTIIKMIFRG
ncbi:MAG: rhamnan synthesis F family protein, partial [Treponema sp.]|nr:rhamnan synthesis F family protein [Treponema sp.]